MLGVSEGFLSSNSCFVLSIQIHDILTYHDTILINNYITFSNHIIIYLLFIYLLFTYYLLERENCMHNDLCIKALFENLGQLKFDITDILPQTASIVRCRLHHGCTNHALIISSENKKL